MRLGRLDLVRYGKFTGRTLDFGTPPHGTPDLHLVYGPNEAGKSTAFAAYLDLLFGIGGQSPYAFLHPYPAMRIGARFDVAGGQRDLVRIKRQSATLLDADERTLDEGLLAAELGGIGREAYRAMFSLDDDTLEQGGKEILASRGDLGQLLFSGSAGAAGLSQTLDRLRAEADALFRPNSGKTALGELRRRLDELKSDRAAIDTQVSVYRQHVETRDKAEAGYQAALAARSAADARRKEIERLLAALPWRDELRDARAALAGFADLPHMPADASETLRRVQRREIELDTERAGIAREIAALEAEIAGIVVEPEALAAGVAYDALTKLGERVRSAADDLPDRRLRLAGSEAAILAGLARLGRPAGSDPATIGIDAGTTGLLRGLVAERSGVAERLKRARSEAADAAREFAEARVAAAGADERTEAERRGMARVAGVLDALRDADGASRVRVAERALPPRTLAFDTAILALAPWAGTAADLATLVLPEPREVEAWAATLRDRTAEVERRADEAARLAEDRQRLAAEVDALGTVAGVVSEAEAVSVRVARERAWATHRARLDADSADAFADALARDDLVTGARFGQAAETARLKETALKLAGLEVKLDQAATREAEARRRLAALQNTIVAALARIVPPLPPDTSPVALGAWMTRRTAALAASTDLRSAERELAEARADAAAARDRLAAALLEVGVAHDPAAPFDRLMATARDAVERGREAEGLVKRVEEQARRAKARARALAEAEAEEAGWQARWGAACASCWLGAAGETPSAEAVGEILEVLGGLAPDMRTRAELGHRIAAMEADAASFAARVAPLAASLDLDPTLPPLDLDRAIGKRIGAAREADAARRDRRARLVKAREQETLAVEAGRANGIAGDALRHLFAVETLAEVAAKLEACAERDRTFARAEAAAREIRTGLRRADLAEAEALLDEVDRQALEAELDTQGARHEAADTELRDHHARRAAALASLDAVGGDEAAARIEGERRTALLAVEDGAVRYLRLSAGIAAAELALRAYRDRHRSAMLARASEAFALVSRNAYRGLAAQPGEKGADVLLAVAADGKSKDASALSKGTRFQLYLALRAAGYLEFAKSRGPVPFIADDILETFDDFRAEEAFRLFTGMAEVGQVIYLTHHRHLIDIARAACPDVRVQELHGTP